MQIPNAIYEVIGNWRWGWGFPNKIKQPRKMNLGGGRPTDPGGNGVDNPVQILPVGNHGPSRTQISRNPTAKRYKPKPTDIVLLGRQACGNKECHKWISSRFRSRGAVVLCDKTCPDRRTYCCMACKNKDAQHRCHSFEYSGKTMQATATMSQDEIIARCNILMEIPRLAIFPNERALPFNLVYWGVCVQCCEQIEDNEPPVPVGIDNNGLTSANSALVLPDQRTVPTTHIFLKGFNVRCKKCFWPVCKTCQKGAAGRLHKVDCDLLRQLKFASGDRHPVDEDPETAYMILALVKVYQLSHRPELQTQFLKLVEESKSVELPFPGYDDWIVKRTLEKCGKYFTLMQYSLEKAKDILKCVMLYKTDHFVGSGPRAGITGNPGDRYSYKILPTRFTFTCRPNIALTVDGDIFTVNTISKITAGQTISLSINSSSNGAFALKPIDQRCLGDMLNSGFEVHRRCTCDYCTSQDDQVAKEREALYGLEIKCKSCKSSSLQYPVKTTFEEWVWKCSTCGNISGFAVVEWLRKLDFTLEGQMRELEQAKDHRDFPAFTKKACLMVKMFDNKTAPKWWRLRLKCDMMRHVQPFLLVDPKILQETPPQAREAYKKAFEEIAKFLQKFKEDLIEVEPRGNVHLDNINVCDFLLKTLTRPMDNTSLTRVMEQRSEIERAAVNILQENDEKETAILAKEVTQRFFMLQEELVLAIEDDS